MDFGLQRQDVDEIIHILQSYPVVEEAILFGSRAKGNFKQGSDIDIAIKGKGIDQGVVASISFLLNEEIELPYFFDIVHFEAISEQELREHVIRVGRSIYVREKGVVANG
jgi:uncharacterized protein